MFLDVAFSFSTVSADQIPIPILEQYGPGYLVQQMMRTGLEPFQFISLFPFLEDVVVFQSGTLVNQPQICRDQLCYDAL